MQQKTGRRGLWRQGLCFFAHKLQGGGNEQVFFFSWCKLSIGAKQINPGGGELCFPKINNCWFMIPRLVWTFLLQTSMFTHFYASQDNSSSLVKTWAGKEKQPKWKPGEDLRLVLVCCGKCQASCRHCRRAGSCWEKERYPTCTLDITPLLLPKHAFCFQTTPLLRLSFISVFFSALSSGQLERGHHYGNHSWLLEKAQGCKSEEKKTVTGSE